MTPAHIELALTVIRLISTAVQQRMREHDELLEMFNRATEEGRDLTDEEVALYRAKAEAAMQSMGELNPLI